MLSKIQIYLNSKDPMLKGVGLNMLDRLYKSHFGLYNELKQKGIDFKSTFPDVYADYEYLKCLKYGSS